MEKDLRPIQDIISIACQEHKIESHLNNIAAGLADLVPKYEVLPSSMVFFFL